MFQQALVKITLVLVSVVVAGCIPSSVSGRARREDEKDGKLLQKTMDAVELGLSFFSQDYSSINVDGLFGMRVGQGEPDSLSLSLSLSLSFLSCISIISGNPVANLRD